MTTEAYATAAAEIAAWYIENAPDVAQEGGAGVTTDAMHAAASYVEREYGYGYTLAQIRGMLGGHGLFAVTFADGTRFAIVADQWGNVAEIAR